MSSRPPLSAKLVDQTGALSVPAVSPTPHGPFAPLAPSDGRQFVTLGMALTALEVGQPHHVAGVTGAASALAARHLAGKGRRVVLVTSEPDVARAAASDASFLVGSSDPELAEATGVANTGRVLSYIPPTTSPYADVNPDRRGAQQRLATLAHLARDEPWRVLVIPAIALQRKVVPPARLLAFSDQISEGDERDRDDLLLRLVSLGYVRAPVVDDPGTFAVRGALIDIWPPSDASPFRVELFGDLVLAIKRFDPDDQRSLEQVTTVSLPPAREALVTEEERSAANQRMRDLCDSVDLPTSRARPLIDSVSSLRSFFGADGFLPAYYDLTSFFDYLPSDAVYLLEDPTGIHRALTELTARLAQDYDHKEGEPRFDPAAFTLTTDEIARALDKRPVVSLHRMVTAGSPDEGHRELDAYVTAPLDAPTLWTHDQSELQRALKQARKARGRSEGLLPLVERISYWHDHGLKVVIAARAQTQVERLVGLLRHRDVAIRAKLGTFDPAWLDATEADSMVVVGPLARGVVAPAEGLVLVTEEEVFGARAHRRQKTAQSAQKGGARPFIEDLRSLEVGDFVVHVEHGIGRYLGLVHRDVGTTRVDLLAVEYHGGDKLYLPVYRLNQIQKFSGGEGSPKLDRLGGQTFARTKARVKKQLRKMADELLRLYAERAAAATKPLPSADDEIHAFEATFPFEETPDQARAISEVDRDLESDRPMDRLVCGDVGFGKTEVAIRAAFRMANDGRQVAVLCPTTVLAQQHLMSFRDRMVDYPFEIRGLSRFQTKAEQNATIRGLRDGKVDIVVGTHRLLSKDVHFKRLGLLVVDEEQRFGVTHKERIKQLRQSVDVLTLSATPIPRTLQMAISGIRDMSIITTPPVDRRAIRTIVTRHDEVVLRQAIDRELGRGGQVFYVYNRVEGLYERANRLTELLPSARIGVAHGQMTETALEQTMIDFVEGRYDILCATAIIESGLDIPRANTIIIDRADMFGLAQLYQLRGRVGRSRERAYCYLIVPPELAMTDEARTRIEALERHSELGSGFQIASLDLELRGAGDLLGADQSGTAAAVGFELFCEMLQESVHELRGEVVRHDVDPELSFDCEALLPDDYINDVGVRLSLYKRLASAESVDEVVDMASEMEDRFGPPPAEARQLVQLMQLKTELRKLRVLGCEASASLVTLHLKDDTPLDRDRVLALIQKKGSAYKLTPDMRLTRRTRDGESFASGLDATDKLLSEISAS